MHSVLLCVIAPSACRCYTHRPLSSSFLGLPYRILNTNHKKELLRGLWVLIVSIVVPVLVYTIMQP